MATGANYLNGRGEPVSIDAGKSVTIKTRTGARNTYTLQPGSTVAAGLEPGKTVRVRVLAAEKGKVADRVEIAGTVRGEIFAKEIVLRSTSKVEAELVFTSLVLDEGAHFEGRSRQNPHPAKAGPRFPAMRSERAEAKGRAADPGFRAAAE